MELRISSEPEKKLFRRLSVFVGSTTLEAIEVVCDPEWDLGIDVLEGVQSLLGKSLLLRSESPDGEPCFSMLDTIREYAREKLEEEDALAPGEVERHCKQHALYYLRLAEEAEPQLAGAQQARWLARLEAEHANLRQALRWAQQHGDTTTELRLAGALWRFWIVYGYVSEGRDQLAIALRQTYVGSQENKEYTEYRAAYAKALIGAAIMAWRQNDYEAAQSCSEESLGIYRETGDKRGVAQSLNNLGNVAHRRGDYVAARNYFSESLAARRELDDKRGMADSLNNLAMVLDEQADYEQARLLYGESLAIYRELNNIRGIANSLNNLGLVAWEQGDLETARQLLGESLPIYKELGDKRGIANSLNNLGLVAWEQGDYDGARALYSEGLDAIPPPR